MIKIISNRKKGGYATLELVFYVIFFAMLSLLVIESLLTMALSFRESYVYSELTRASNMMEIISRELRQANDFSFTSNTLVLNTRDNTGNPKTISYVFSENNIEVVDSVLGDLGNLNSANISVVSFNVVTIPTTIGKAAKLSMEIELPGDTLGRTENFNNTLVLRGSY